MNSRSSRISSPHSPPVRSVPPSSSEDFWRSAPPDWESNDSAMRASLPKTKPRQWSIAEHSCNGCVRGIYERLRKSGWAAYLALYQAKTLDAFQTLEAAGLVRLQVLPDEAADLENLKGDCFNPKYFVGSRSQLKAEEKAFEEKVARDGVWGIVAEFFSPDSDAWEHVDAVWGFVGDEWRDSGYDADVMHAALKHAKAHGYSA